MRLWMFLVLSLLLFGCASSTSPGLAPRPTSSSDWYSMTDLLLALPQRYWESPPTLADLQKVFPAGIPEEFINIPGGGAQNEFVVYRLDGRTIALAVGEGENPDYASTINPVGRNFEVLRRNTHGWDDITITVIPRKFEESAEAHLYSGGRLQVFSKDRQGPILNLVYNGKRFVPAAE